MNDQSQINEYHKAYLEDYGFEAEIVAARQRKVLEVFSQAKPKTIIEVSCGPELLYTKALENSIVFDQWIIVEPNAHFAKIAVEKHGSDKKLHIIQDFFENTASKINKICQTPIDLIIFSGILNEVSNPEELLNTAKNFMGNNSRIHVNVPNALSLHRRLGKVMGLIPDEKAFSDKNIKLNQPRVYDMTTLQKILTDNGFSPEQNGGYFLKPFSHKQMAKIKNVLTDEVLDGLWTLGTNLPELATEIFINAKRINEP